MAEGALLTLFQEEILLCHHSLAHELPEQHDSDLWQPFHSSNVTPVKMGPECDYRIT